MGEGVVVDGGAEDTGGAVAEEFGEFVEAAVGCVGAVNVGGDDGGIGARDEERDARLEGSEFACLCAGSFGEQDHLFSLVEEGADGLKDGYVASVAAHGVRIDGADEAAE